MDRANGGGDWVKVGKDEENGDICNSIYNKKRK